MLSYASVQLQHPTADDLAWAEENIDPAWLGDFAERTWNLPGLSALDIRGCTRRVPQRIGVLSWPVGAVNFAAGYFLATEDQLAQIRTNLSGTSTAAFVMDDGRKSITASLSMLPARPLARVQRGTPGLYLLTLVDQRYRWWYAAQPIGCPDGTQWNTLVAEIANALNISINVTEAISGNYATASPAYELLYGPIPPLLDAVARSVGKRVVCGLDGTVYLMGYDASIARQAANMALALRLAGDQLDLDATLTPDDLDLALPQFFCTAFVQGDARVTSLPLLALPQFPGVTGFPGTKLWHAMPDGLTPTQKDDLNTQAATDYYLHQASRVDAVYEGAVPWQPEGLTDLIEWEQARDVIRTRCRRMPWYDHAGEDPFPIPIGSGSGSGSAFGCEPIQFDEWQDRCEGGRLYRYVRTVNLIQDPFTKCLLPPYFDPDWSRDVQVGYCDLSYCPPASFVMEVTHCEPSRSLSTVTGTQNQSVNNIYQRTYQLVFVNGCPRITWDGIETYVRTEGCCACPPPGFVFCLCPVGGPSGSPSGSAPCIPGVCSLCADPPYAFYIVAEGFSGLCDVFNGNWWLTNTAPCAWSQTVIHLNLPITVTLTLSQIVPGGGGASYYAWVLSFTFGLPGDALATASYLLKLTGDPPFNCCQVLNLAKQACSCAGGSGSGSGGSGSAGGCECCSGGTPAGGYSINPVGFTGDFEMFNQQFSLTSAGDPCVWDFAGDVISTGVSYKVLITLTIQCDPGLTSFSWALSFVVLGLGISALYKDTESSSPDCCAIQALAFSLQNGLGSCPASIGVDPQGACGTPPPIAPDIAGGCSGCNGQTPDTWAVGLTATAGCWAEMNGTWDVPANGVCSWEKTFTVSGGTLTINISISNPNAGPPFLLLVTVNFQTGDDTGYSQALFSIYTFDGDCCMATTAALTGQTCNRTIDSVGVPPQIASLTPDCTNATPGGCPPVISAEPLCCGSGGSGSGSGSGGGVSTTCCPPGTPGMPTNLHFTWTTPYIAGYGGWLPASVPLAYDAASQKWISPCYAITDPLVGVGYVNFKFFCNLLATVWNFSADDGLTTAASFTDCVAILIQFTPAFSWTPSANADCTGVGVGNISFNTVSVTL